MTPAGPVVIEGFARAGFDGVRETFIENFALRDESRRGVLRLSR